MPVGPCSSYLHCIVIEQQAQLVRSIVYNVVVEETAAPHPALRRTNAVAIIKYNVSTQMQA